ncbi:NADH-dependent fumarate reductase subunit C [Hydrogenivirga caldilitoris]|uniref:NADH-dependent fumarate reductase subunit C n=1 Tax=Hydrogenivirga caldilitoris TaxID=246264 RepID=A0A497XS17_9AQUI|nr:dehydrogenase [Hydrogenivirga caldilitoris]RLJ70889.1 NADH-dependent fumarate reductase subunit C [Hydrogenivirga caldilitoris]
MSLKPTNVPLTVKDFDCERCGVCAGCGCACGYIAYLKGEDLVDLYGHPHDPNGIGSFCTKGLTLIQETPKNPLRLRKAILRDGGNYKEIDQKDALEWLNRNLKGRVAVFLDRFSDLKDYVSAVGFTEHVYTDSLYLPFRATTLRPQEWREQRVILALECETVFTEVMATRWLVDAFERSSYIVAVSSRYGTTSAKASRRILVKPSLVVRFIEELADYIEGKDKELMFKEEIERLAKSISLVKESLILIGETLLRSRWRGNVLSALKRIRDKVRVNYSIVGNVSPLKAKGLEEFLKEFTDFDSLLLTGNPAMFMDETLLNKLKEKRTVHLTLFPNLTANNVDLVIPVKLFAEREFFPYKNGFGLVAYSPQVLPSIENSFAPHELLGNGRDIEEFLNELGLGLEEVREAEGGADVDIPYIEEWEGEFNLYEVEDRGIYVLCDNTLVDEIGHWNVWTHDMESQQLAYMNSKTMERLGVKEEIEIRGTKLKVKKNSNIADDVIFVPNSYEESQPFNPGTRPGKLLKNPAFRIEEYG